jgi:hypothetical protein
MNNTWNFGFSYVVSDAIKRNFIGLSYVPRLIFSDGSMGIGDFY